MSSAWVRAAFYVGVMIFVFGGFVYFGNALGDADDGAPLGAALMTLMAFYLSLRSLLYHQSADQSSNRLTWIYFGSFAYCCLLFLGYFIFKVATR